MRHSLTTGLLALTLALPLTLAPAPAAAQEDLGSLLSELASLWERGDARGLAAHTASNGLELEVRGRGIGPISDRKVAAALRRIFSGQETVAVRPALTARVEGAAGTAFGELLWAHRPEGIERAERSTIFIGLVREGREWRVSQIRILP